MGKLPGISRKANGYRQAIRHGLSALQTTDCLCRNSTHWDSSHLISTERIILAFLKLNAAHINLAPWLPTAAIFSNACRRSHGMCRSPKVEQVARPSGWLCVVDYRHPLENLSANTSVSIRPSCMTKTTWPYYRDYRRVDHGVGFLNLSPVPPTPESM